MARRKRSRRRLILFVLLQVVLCLALLELALKLAEPFSQSLRMLLWRPRAAVDYSGVETVTELLETTIVGHQPFHDHGGFVLNSRGFRTPEYATQPAPDVTRIVALGDSFTFSCSGIPFDEFWPVLVERGLAARREQPVEVVNLAMPATGPAFYARMWELEGATLQPDLVLLAFFVGNDFQMHERLGREEGQLPGWLASIRLVRLVHNALRIQQADLLPPTSPDELRVASTPDRGGYPAAGYAERYKSVKPRMSREYLLRTEARRMLVCDRTRTHEFELDFERVTEILDGLWRQIDERGIPGLVVVIPDRFQVNPRDREAVLAAQQRSEMDFDWERPQRLLGEYLARRGVPCIDLLTTFREASNAFELYSPGDTHWSPQGCALAAEQILGFLDQHPELLAP